MRIEYAPGIFIEPPPGHENEVLASINEEREANPLLGYFPYDHQRAYHEANTPIKALIAGNQSGKTHSSLADDLIQLLDEDFLPDHLKPYKRWDPPVSIWIGCPKFDKLFDTIIPKLRELIPKAALKGGGFDTAFSKQHKTVHFLNGSQITFKTYDQDVDAYSGASIHRMHWDEEPEGDHGLAIRQEARIRLLKHGGDECLSMTPLFGYSWVHEHVYERRHEPSITVINADMDDNPSLTEAAKKEVLAGYSEDEIKARKRGEFVHFGGTFFGMFSDREHVRDEIENEHLEGQDVVVGIDPGLRHTGIVWLAFDNDNSAIVFDEFYPGEGLVPDFAREIKARNQKWGLKKKPRYVIDPSARNRNAINADQIEAAYAREGIYCEHGQNDRGAGILEVQRRLSFGSLVVTRNCVDTIRQFPRYRRDPNTSDEWAAIKVDDDLLDAIRYGVMTRVWHQPPRPKHPKHPSYGERPGFVPPASEERFIEQATPLGSFT